MANLSSAIGRRLGARAEGTSPRSGCNSFSRALRAIDRRETLARCLCWSVCVCVCSIGSHRAPEQLAGQSNAVQSTGPSSGGLIIDAFERTGQPASKQVAGQLFAGQSMKFPKPTNGRATCCGSVLGVGLRARRWMARAAPSELRTQTQTHTSASLAIGDATLSRLGAAEAERRHQ